MNPLAPQGRVLRLASRSPQRAELLREADISFVPGPYPDIDERVPADLPSREVVSLLATQKLEAVRARLEPCEIALCADTLDVLDGEPLGKPSDAAQARDMLQALSGQEHRVMTGVALAGAVGSVLSDVAVTVVRFHALSSAAIEAYVATEEPQGKAGAYAIQGGAAAFVASLQGARDTVIGLPMDLVRALLSRLG